MLSDVQGILDAGDGELSVDASAKADDLLSKIDGISRMITAATNLEAERGRVGNPDVARLVSRGSGMSSMPGGRTAFESANGPVFQDANGNKIQAKASTEMFSNSASDGASDGAVGEMIC